MWNITRPFLVNWRFMLQIQWAALLNLPVTWKWSLTFSSTSLMSFFTNPAIVTWLVFFFFFFFFFFSYDQIFMKIFFHYFFTVFTLFKNCFNKFISSIFISKNDNWLTQSIINANSFVSKTTRNTIVLFLWVGPFTNFKLL